MLIFPIFTDDADPLTRYVKILPKPVAPVFTVPVVSNGTLLLKHDPSLILKDDLGKCKQNLLLDHNYRSFCSPQPNEKNSFPPKHPQSSACRDFRLNLPGSEGPLADPNPAYTHDTPNASKRSILRHPLRRPSTERRTLSESNGTIANCPGSCEDCSKLRCSHRFSESDLLAAARDSKSGSGSDIEDRENLKTGPVSPVHALNSDSRVVFFDPELNYTILLAEEASRENLWAVAETDPEGHKVLQDHSYIQCEGS